MFSSTEQAFVRECGLLNLTRVILNHIIYGDKSLSALVLLSWAPFLRSFLYISRLQGKTSISLLKFGALQGFCGCF